MAMEDTENKMMHSQDAKTKEKSETIHAYFFPELGLTVHAASLADAHKKVQTLKK